MDTNTKVAAAVVFVWLGLLGTVLAILFVEAPLKFRAPGVTLKVGVGIGRLAFRALNVFEYVFVIVIAAALFTHQASGALTIALCVPAAALLTQTVVVRPLLTQGTDAALDGDEGPRSWARVAYIALELVKVIALVWAGVLLVGA